MIQISQMKLKIPHTQKQLEDKIVKLLHIRPQDIAAMHIRKKSLDARKKPELFYVYTVDVEVKKEAELKTRFSTGFIKQISSYRPHVFAQEEIGYADSRGI